MERPDDTEPEGGLPGGVVVGIYLARSAGGPMESPDRSLLERGRGLVGDRYATGQGYWSRWPDPAGKALTLVAAEVLDEIGVDAGTVRRNVVTAGVDLAALIGKVFRLGDATCLGVRPCLPCRYLEDATRPGLRALLAGSRGGLRADVIAGGEVAVGDRLWVAGTALAVRSG